ncbi:MAG: GIY-YIG nuclease family protein, partial [Puniceicoccales bacterium]
RRAGGGLSGSILQQSLQLRLGMPASKNTYVYILRSEKNPDLHYTGCTKDLHSRLKKHNNGHIPHTAKFRPWFIETAISFRDTAKARDFEKF